MHHRRPPVHDREHRAGGASGEEEPSLRDRRVGPSHRRRIRRTVIRAIAVDWSGAAEGARRKIWLAEAREGQLLRLESGRTREELIDHFQNVAEDDRDLVVGLDFAFSLPAWFLEERDLGSARELWRLVGREGEDWLDRCEPPFWGRPGTTKPDDLPAHFRKTEQEVRQATGAWPKSPFQVGGAGAVGTGSLRGMPHLLELSEAGFSIWPFDEPSLPVVVEIYPRLLTGEVKKSDPDARLAYLRREYPGLREAHLEEAAASDDSFDAAVSALAMDARSGELSAPGRSSDPVTRLEGAIWRPERSARRGGHGLDEALVYARTLHEGQRRKGPEDTLLVSCADKVYNARSMLRDHRIHGDALWDRSRSSAEDNLWYYRGLVEAFRAAGLESWLVDELEWTVERLADCVSHDGECGV